MKYKIFNFFKMQKFKLYNIYRLNSWELKSAKSRTKKMKIILLTPVRVIKVFLKREVIISYIEIVVTTFCNLKCKGCSALMEYYKNPKHIDIKDNIRALQRIVDSNVTVRTLRVLGGEPLCYPDLYKLLEYLKTQDKIKKVEIVTNGKLLLRDEKMINLLKDYKFWFSVSRYEEASTNFDKLIDQLKENNINYIPQSENYEWVDYGNFERRNRSEKDLIAQYHKCTHKCNNLLNGRLFHCHRCSHATNLRLISLIKRDYVDLFDENVGNKQLKKQLYKFIYGYTPYIEACNYCDCGINNKKIKRGRQNNMGDSKK